MGGWGHFRAGKVKEPLGSDRHQIPAKTARCTLSRCTFVFGPLHPSSLFFHVQWPEPKPNALLQNWTASSRASDRISRARETPQMLEAVQRGETGPSP